MCLGRVQELPEDFDASVTLAGADASSKDSIMDTFPVVFVMRWLMLRSEVGCPLLQKLACTDTCSAMATNTLCFLPHHAHHCDTGAGLSQSSGQIPVTSFRSISPDHHYQCHVSPTMLLRQAVTAVQLPEERLEVYGKGQHLRGTDAAFADQVLDELVSHLQPVPSSSSSRAVQHAICSAVQVDCAAAPAYAGPQNMLDMA